MWLELHDGDRIVYVNMDNATDFRRWNPDDKHTQIALGGYGDKGRTVLVTDAPDEIAKLIQTEQRKAASQQ